MTPLNLICFPGAPNLPIFAADELGIFKKYDIEIDLTTTPSSIFQIENMMAGEFQIAGTAFDNIVAYQEGQGAVEIAAKPDLFAFMGATQIELSLVVAPEIESFDDLKGKSLALDALATGFAFILYRMLENAGLSLDDCPMIPVGATPDRWASVQSGEHAGTLTIEPFTAMARAQGFHVLESSLATVEHYQGGVFATRRSWASNNEAALMGYISGYLDGLRWVLNPDNGEQAKEILLRNMPAINPKAVNNVMAKLLSSKTGLTPNGALLPAGIDTVLQLRSHYAQPAKVLGDPDRYVDLSYLEASRQS
jgi:ABC-type nitrate/sulfonate/bicarbonate transport system substrate-binding protein